MPVRKGTTLDPAATRESVLERATPLLYAHGVDGIGVAELCARLAISKETLYRHFGSKDGLIEAVLARRSERVADWLSRAAATAGADPYDQLDAVCDAYAEWQARDDFRGCAIVNAAAQRSTAATRDIAARHLRKQVERLAAVARSAGVPDPERAGAKLLLLLEGSAVMATHAPGLLADDELRQMARQVLLDHTPRPHRQAQPHDPRR